MVGALGTCFKGSCLDLKGAEHFVTGLIQNSTYESLDNRSTLGEAKVDPKRSMIGISDTEILHGMKLILEGTSLRRCQGCQLGLGGRGSAGNRYGFRHCLEIRVEQVDLRRSTHRPEAHGCLTA